MSQFMMREYDLESVVVLDPINGSLSTLQFGVEEEPFSNYWVDEMGLHYTVEDKGCRMHVPMWRIVYYTSKK